MALHAKPSGGYDIGTDEWNDNISALWAYCYSQGYTVQAFAGMFGNAQQESGQNPWRYQDDSLSGAGYGLFQYTPKAGYLQEYYTNSSGNTVRGYGYGYDYFAPNYSVTSVSSGALATDAYCQIDGVSRSGKYSANSDRRTRIASYVSDYSNYETLDNFKTCTDVEKATYLWLGFFEYPGWWRDRTNVSSNFNTRYSAARSIYNLVKDDTDPDIPDTPVTPTPTPVPITNHKMKIMFYMKRRWVL